MNCPRLQFEFPGSVNGWMFPHRTGGNVGVGALRLPTQLLNRALDKVIEQVSRNNDGLVDEGSRKAHPIPVRPRKCLVKGRALLVGDAAGLASPITGEGISYALTSGRLAGNAVSDMILDGGSPAFLRSYERAVRKEAVSTLNAARVISTCMQRVVDCADVDHLMKAFQKEPGLISTSAMMCRGEEEWKSS